MHLIVQQMALAPACCLLCRGDKTPAVDFCTDLDEFAHRVERLYLCGNCVRDLAHDLSSKHPEVGWAILRQERLDAIEAEHRRLLDANADLLERAEAAEEALAAIRRVDAAAARHPAGPKVIDTTASATAMRALGPKTTARPRKQPAGR